MRGTGTQSSPFYPTNWSEFVEAVGTQGAYVECPKEKWDMSEILPGGLAERITIAAAHVNGNGLTLSNLNFVSGCFQFDNYAEGAVEQVVQKLYFLDFFSAFSEQSSSFFVKDVNSLSHPTTLLKNCKFTGIVDVDELTTGYIRQGFIQAFDYVDIENSVIFTDDGEKGCYIKIAFRNGTSLAGAETYKNVKFYNCHLDLVDASRFTDCYYEKCYIRGSARYGGTIDANDCVFDMFFHEGEKIYGLTRNEYRGAKPYTSVINGEINKAELSAFPGEDYVYGIANTSTLSDVAFLSGLQLATAVLTQEGAYIVEARYPSKNYLEAPIDNLLNGTYSYASKSISCPTKGGMVKLCNISGENAAGYVYIVKLLDDNRKFISNYVNQIPLEEAENLEIPLSDNVAYIRIEMRNANGSNLTGGDFSFPYKPADFDLIFVGGELRKNTWVTSPDINYGNVYHELLPDLPIASYLKVKQEDYITIYDSLSPVETFETHGLAVLSPTKCEITEEYQGKWAATLEHPRDVDGKHKHIKPFNIIKAMGQLFSIVSVSNKIPGIITAKAEHIFYHLNDRWIFPGARIISTSVSGLMLSAKLASSDFSTENQISHDFSFSSDINDLDLGVKSNAKWGYTQEGMSLAEFVLGAGNLLDMSGGELYRDNFYYSINARMENSNDTAFEIRVGKDLTGIKRTVDTSRLCTYFRVYNGLDSSHGTWFAVSYTDVTVDAVAPHSIIRSKTFTPQIPFWITDEDEVAKVSDELVAEEGMRFFRENGTPDIRYEISIADINGNPDFAEFSNLPDYRVGNIGKIYDERLGVEAKLKITKTVKDAITGNTISVVFGELIGETKIVESVKSLKTADGQVLYTADGEVLQTRE